MKQLNSKPMQRFQIFFFAIVQFVDPPQEAVELLLLLLKRVIFAGLKAVTQ